MNRWLCEKLNLETLDMNTIKQCFQIENTTIEELTQDEIMICVLYYIVSRKKFEKIQSKRDIMFVKFIQADIEELMKHVTLRHDWLELFGSV